MCGFRMQNSDLWTRKTSLYGSQTWPVALWMQIGVISIRPTSLYLSQPSSVFFLMQYSAFWTRISSLYGSQTSSVVLSTHNCELNTRIKRQYWIQPSPVGLCMQNSDFRTRITSLWGSKTSPVVFAYKTASSGPEQQVSMGPRYDLSFCACTTAGLTSDLLFSMGPSPLQWFLHAKQRD